MKKGYEIINAIIPKDVGYGTPVNLDKHVFERIRKIVFKKTESQQNAGYSWTQITGSGMLGSDEKLQQGLARGDVVMKVIKGKSVYFMSTMLEEESKSDSHEAKVKGTASVNSKMFQELMELPWGG